MKIAIKTSFDGGLENAEKSGFKCVELYTERKLISSVYADTAKNFPFEYSVHVPVDYIDEAMIDFALDIGSRIVITHFIVPIERLTEIVDYARKLKIIVCIENSPGHAPWKLYGKTETAKDFFEIKKSVPNIKMNLDIEHAIVSGVFPGIIQEVGRDIKHVHITGYPPNPHSPPYENPSVFRIVIDELKKIGYHGFISAETDLQYQNEATFKRIREFMESVIKK